MGRLPAATACVLVVLGAAAVSPARSDLARPRSPPGADSTDLVSALGCGACHTGVPDPVVARRAAPSLGSDGRAWQADSLLAYLLSPSPSRTGSSPARMPTFHLSEPEALALTLYLEGTLPAAPGGGADRVDALREEHPRIDARLGRRIFAALDCSGCHGGTDVPAWKSAPDLSDEGRRARGGWLTSWLAHPVAVRPFGFFPGTGTRMPDFGLTGTEVERLVAYLSGREAGGGFASPPRPDTLSPFRRAEATRLLSRRSACLGCHALRGDGGRIGPDLQGVAFRRPAAYVWAMISDPRGTRPRTVMPRTPEAPARDTLLYRLLLTRASEATPSPRSRAPDHDGYLDLTENVPLAPDPWMVRGEDGPSTAAVRYRHLCASCHGAAGGGDGFNAPHLPVPPARHADSAAMSVRTDARLFDAVHGGGRVLGRSPRMPAFGRSLDRKAIWGLVGHIRDLCGCRAPAWYRDNGESEVPDSSAGASPASGSGPTGPELGSGAGSRAAAPSHGRAPDR